MTEMRTNFENNENLQEVVWPSAAGESYMRTVWMEGGLPRAVLETIAALDQIEVTADDEAIAHQAIVDHANNLRRRG